MSDDSWKERIAASKRESELHDEAVREKERVACDNARGLLRGIEEQIEKRQYWNALGRANELARELMRAFDAVLKS